MNIYVGNLSRAVTEEELRRAFEPFGKVDSATLVKDRFSGEPRGFGFVDMPVQTEAEAAITGLNGKELQGQALVINEARPRKEHRGGNRERRGGNRDRRGDGNRSGGGGRFLP
jgi:RNA recognition motif-containing protein